MTLKALVKNSWFNWSTKPLVLALCFAIALPDVPLISDQKAFGRTYNQGRSLYLKGNLKKSTQALTQALKRRSPPALRAQTYKLLGIIAFMENRRSKASQYFKAALKINPKITISNQEVLDPTVIPFFKNIARSRRPGSQNRRKQAVSAAPGGTKKKLTTITIKTPKPATISIDGILAGNSGIPIEVQPGINILTLKSKGFITKKVKVQAVKNRQTNLSVSMKKIVKKKPKPKPRPVATRAPSSRKKKKKDLFADEEPTYQNQRRNQGRSLVNEFDSDGGYTPAPAYQPYPGYAPPPPPPTYYPPPPTYAPPPVYAPPPSYGLSPGYQAQPDYFGDAPSRRKRRKKVRKKEVGSTFVTLLPLGAGQIQNEDYILAAGVALGQIIPMFLWYDLSQEQDKAIDDLARLRSSESENISKEEREAKDQEFTNFIDEADQTMMIYLVIAGASWGAGVLEANLNRKMVKVKSRKRRRFSISPTGGLQLDVSQTLMKDTPKYHVNLIPETNSGTVEFGVDWSF